MQDTATTNGTPPVPVVPISGQWSGSGVAPTFERERVQALLAAIEEPFDVSEIKWRVTNTTQVGSKSGPRYRGQMLAYADPRAYTDRLNDLFTPTGWTRDYNVQMVQNFERRERGATERTITAKIVVTCKVTVYGLGAHTGLGVGGQRQRGHGSGSSGVQAGVFVFRAWPLSVRSGRPVDGPR